MTDLKTQIKHRLKEAFDDAMSAIDGVASEFDYVDEYIDEGFQGQPAPATDDITTIGDSSSINRQARSIRKNFIDSLKYEGQAPNAALDGGDTLGAIDANTIVDEEGEETVRQMIAKRSLAKLKLHIVDIRSRNLRSMRGVYRERKGDRY